MSEHLTPINQPTPRRKVTVVLTVRNKSDLKDKTEAVENILSSPNAAQSDVHIHIDNAPPPKVEQRTIPNELLETQIRKVLGDHLTEINKIEDAKRDGQKQKADDPVTELAKRDAARKWLFEIGKKGWRVIKWSIELASTLSQLWPT